MQTKVTGKPIRMGEGLCTEGASCVQEAKSMSAELLIQLLVLILMIIQLSSRKS